LSASASQASIAPSWKQEVNQRLAAHKSRKDSSTARPDAPAEVLPGASSRAAQAAARVAARYAKAPSYSEMLADEARAAVRAAEAASRAALNAQAAAESVLAGLEAASVPGTAWELDIPCGGVPERKTEQAREPSVEPAAPFVRPTPGRESFGIRWEPDMPVRPAEPAAARASRGTESFAISAQDWWESPQQAEDALGAEAIESVEPAQPIHANLIEFPRELVATRKVRPRLAEGAHAAASESSGQLSIFEVDPGTVSTQPAAEAAPESAAKNWQGPEWSGIELEAQSMEETASQAEPVPAAPVLELAPMSRRLMAVVVDGALIIGAFLAAAMVAAENIKDLPNLRTIEMGAVAALFVTAILYQTLFFILAKATPGMKYARISLCTFDDERPTRVQMRSRLGALLLSVAPMGLGVAWAIFDDDHLSWHDRLSRTYLRKC
jgi:uncharacterized RDD family membrane protein YckC